MAAQTGQTISRWLRFVVEDSAGTMREVPVSGISILGLKCEEMDMSAFQDAVKEALAGQPEAPIEITGPFDSSAAQAVAASAAAPALSGSHTILYNLTLPAYVGVARSVGVYFGMRHYWETGEPVWGLIDGYTCSQYTVDPTTMRYTARFIVFPGKVPDWGTAAIAAS